MVLVTQGLGSRRDGVVVSQGYGNSLPHTVDCKGDIQASMSKNIKIKVVMIKDG